MMKPNASTLKRSPAKARRVRGNRSRAAVRHTAPKIGARSRRLAAARAVAAPAPVLSARRGARKSEPGAKQAMPDTEVIIPAETLARAVVVPVESGPAAAKPGESRTTSAPETAPDRGPWDENTSLRLYLREAVATDLLTTDQEIVLAKRIQAGDDEAREHMIKANLRLVVKIAREYEDYGLPLLDLINEGNIGLMHAVERFDPTKGAKLSTYAAWWIKQSIRRALSNQSKSIRLPIHIVQELARMKKAETRLEADLGRAATDGELAAELEATLEDIQRWREAAAIGATSLDAPLGNDPDSNRVADVISDENAVMPWTGVSEETNAELIRDLVGTLNQREQRILRERFALDGGEPKTLEEIGFSFGLTRERIRQLEAAALKKLRDRFKAREQRHLRR